MEIVPSNTATEIICSYSTRIQVFTKSIVTSHTRCIKSSQQTNNMAFLPSLRGKSSVDSITKRSLKKSKSNRSNGSSTAASSVGQQKHRRRSTKKQRLGSFFQKSKNDQEETPPVSMVSIGGGYRSGLQRSDPSSRLVVVANNTSDEDKPSQGSSSSSSSSWTSSGERNYHRHSPLIVKKRDEPLPEKHDAATELGMVMARSRKLPDMWYFSSNHIMVNKERLKHHVAPLTRNRQLDGLAREHAEAMSRQQRVFHSSSNNNSRVVFRRMGENVASGGSIKAIHQNMVKKSVADKNNMVDRRYTQMGMGTAKGHDGTLYLCQIFRG